MKLASLELIQSIYPHPDADKLELCKVLGYQCIVPKSAYQQGQMVLFVQPDTQLPDDEWAAEFKKYSPKRVKAIKLRGQWSEGIIVNLDKLAGLLPTTLTIGEDVSEHIHVSKYELPPPADQDKQNLDILGILPFSMPKTDEERFENIEKLPFGDLVDVSLKIDGQSCTIYYHLEQDRFGVCGRNYEYKTEAENNFTSQAAKIKPQLIAYCRQHQLSLALRGENYGVGIQRGGHNPHSFLEKGFACFNVYNLTERRYERKGSPLYFAELCPILGVETVPILEKDQPLSPELLQKYSVGIKQIDGKKFEGVVIKHPNFSFKVINKHYDSEK